MEVKSKQCKICNEIKAAYWDDGNYRNDGKTKILHDDNGKQWNGRICGSCQILNTRKNMKALREKRKLGV